MVWGISKWLKETGFYERNKEIIIKTWPFHERKVHIKKKGRVYEFSDKGKVHITDFWEFNEVFFNPLKMVERWSFLSTKLAWYFRKWERWYLSSLNKR